jgi:hypothetical protein
MDAILQLSSPDGTTVAIIIAKSQKIAERVRNDQERLKAKDVSDVYRLLRGHDVDDLQERFASLAMQHDISDEFQSGLTAVQEIFITGSRGRELFVDAVGDFDERAELIESYRYLIEDLGRVIDRLR